MNKKVAYISLSIIVVGVVVLIIINNNKKKKEILKIRKQIQEEVGQSGDESIRALLFNVGPLPSYDEDAKKFAKQIYNAKGGGWLNVFPDDEDSVYEALSGKSKYQIKTIDIALMNNHGSDIHDHLKSFMGESEYDKAYIIVKSARL